MWSLCNLIEIWYLTSRNNLSSLASVRYPAHRTKWNLDWLSKKLFCAMHWTMINLLPTIHSKIYVSLLTIQENFNARIHFHLTNHIAEHLDPIFYYIFLLLNFLSLLFSQLTSVARNETQNLFSFCVVIFHRKRACRERIQKQFSYHGLSDYSFVARADRVDF